jgi:hypothetical protein
MAEDTNRDPDRRPVEERHYTGSFVFEPPEGYRIEPFDGDGSGSASVAPAEVLAMWEREGAMPTDVGRARIPEVLLVAVTEVGEIAGVCTTYLREVDQIRMDLWHTRIFIPKAHRATNLGLVLIERALRTHEERFASGEDSRGPGIAYVVENKGLRERFNQAFWLQPEATFIGENQVGHHVRVYYFPGATVPPPPST